MNKDKIQDWIKNYLSELVDIPVDKIDVTMPFENFGLSSAAAVALIGDLEDYLDADISPALLFEASDIAEVSAAIVEELQL